jgi:hypothetical protein
MTALETHRFVEKLMLPLLAGTWATIFAADQTNEESEPDRAVANGQVFLIRKSAYDAVGGHAAVRARIVEDVELMRLLKKSGFKTRFYAGRHLASTRMHTHLGQMFHAWARIFAGTARGSVWPMVMAILFLVICVLSVLPVAVVATALQSVPWAFAAAAHAVLAVIVCGLIWIWSGTNPLYAVLLPISSAIEIAILGFSIRRAMRGSVTWRGVNIALRDSSRQAS